MYEERERALAFAPGRTERRVKFGSEPVARFRPVRLDATSRFRLKPSSVLSHTVIVEDTTVLYDKHIQ